MIKLIIIVVRVHRYLNFALQKVTAFDGNNKFEVNYMDLNLKKRSSLASKCENRSYRPDFNKSKKAPFKGLSVPIFIEIYALVHEEKSKMCFLMFVS